MILCPSLGKTKFKRIRQESQESTTESEIPSQPRKRIRKISSDSGDETVDPDSQGTVGYSLESQRSDATEVYSVDLSVPLTADQEKKIKFLADCFTDKSDKVNLNFEFKNA